MASDSKCCQECVENYRLPAAHVPNSDHLAQVLFCVVEDVLSPWIGGRWLVAHHTVPSLTLTGFSPVAATNRPFLPPPLRHPRLAPIPRTPDTPASWPRMPRPKTILFPELASLLVHPDVDSYGDAPKVPGQPDLSVSPPSFLEYIHCVEEVLPPAVIQGCESQWKHVQT